MENNGKTVNRTIRRGAPVEALMGGQVRTYIVSPLSLGQIEQFEGVIRKYTEATATSFEWRDLAEIIPMVTAAFRRNYPEITEDEVKQVVDLGNLEQIITAVVGRSRVETFEGEPLPVAASIGDGSTPESPQPPGGASTLSATN